MSGGRPPGRDLEAFALKKKVLRLETLYDVSRSLSSAREEKALLDKSAAAVHELVNVIKQKMSACRQVRPRTPNTAFHQKFKSLSEQHQALA